MSDCQTRIHSQRTCVETARSDVCIFGCCLTVVRSLYPGPGGGRIFPRRGFSVPFLLQRLANLHLGGRWRFVHCVPMRGAKSCAKSFARCIRTKQSCIFGPRVVTIPCSQYFVRALVLRQWRIEYEPDQQYLYRALQVLGLIVVATSGTDDASGFFAMNRS